MKHFFRGQRLAVMSVLLGILLAGAVSVYAATTIGTDISTGGNLTVRGMANIGPDESTLDSYIQGYAGAQNLIVGLTTDVSSVALGVTAQAAPGNDSANGIWPTTLGKYSTALQTDAFTNVAGGTAQGIVGDAGVLGNVVANYVIELYADRPVYDNGGSSVNAFGLWVQDQAGGGVTNSYGIKVEDQTAGANHYAIKTGLGTVSLGGNVGIGTTTPATKLQISAGANATTTVTIGELGLSSSKGCVNINASDGSAGSFYMNAAHQLVAEANYCR